MEKIVRRISTVTLIDKIQVIKEQIDVYSLRMSYDYESNIITFTDPKTNTDLTSVECGSRSIIDHLLKQG